MTEPSASSSIIRSATVSADSELAISDEEVDSGNSGIIQPVHTASTHNNDFVRVQPVSYDRLYTLDSSAIVISEEGYIETPGEKPRMATVTVAPSWGINVITMNRALELNLEVQEHQADEAVTAQFDDRTAVTSIGKVVFTWHKGINGEDGQYTPFTVHCDVFEHPEPSLVFGRQFVDRQQYYWHRVAQ